MLAFQIALLSAISLIFTTKVNMPFIGKVENSIQFPGVLKRNEIIKINLELSKSLFADKKMRVSLYCRSLLRQGSKVLIFWNWHVPGKTGSQAGLFPFPSGFRFSALFCSTMPNPNKRIYHVSFSTDCSSRSDFFEYLLSMLFVSSPLASTAIASWEILRWLACTLWPVTVGDCAGESSV